MCLLCGSGLSPHDQYEAVVAVGDVALAIRNLTVCSFVVLIN